MENVVKREVLNGGFEKWFSDRFEKCKNLSFYGTLNSQSFENIMNA